MRQIRRPSLWIFKIHTQVSFLSKVIPYTIYLPFNHYTLPIEKKYWKYDNFLTMAISVTFILTIISIFNVFKPGKTVRNRFKQMLLFKVNSTFTSHLGLAPQTTSLPPLSPLPLGRAAPSPHFPTLNIFCWPDCLRLITTIYNCSILSIWDYFVLWLGLNKTLLWLITFELMARLEFTLNAFCLEVLGRFLSKHSCVRSL